MGSMMTAFAEGLALADKVRTGSVSGGGGERGTGGRGLRYGVRPGVPGVGPIALAAPAVPPPSAYCRTLVTAPPLSPGLAESVSLTPRAPAHEPPPAPPHPTHRPPPAFPLPNLAAPPLPLPHQVGLRQQDVIDVVGLGAIAAPMFALKGPAMAARAYAPAFPLKHQQKDMRLALALG